MFGFALAPLSNPAAWMVGLGSNLVGLAVLWWIGTTLQCLDYVVLVLGVQWGVAALHGLPWRSERYYDVSGSLTHLAVSLALLLDGPPHPRAVVASFLATVWCVRLGTYLFERIVRDGRDKRFRYVAKHRIRFLGAWTTQAVWVVTLQLPILLLHRSTDARPLDRVDGVGWALWCVGFGLETVSDMQKNIFRCANRSGFVTTGLWAYCRHPNYLGEIMMWTGICCTAAPGFRGTEHLGWLSVGVTVLLLCFVSGIPPIEAEGWRRWGHLRSYRRYIHHTNRLLPWPPAAHP